MSLSLKPGVSVRKLQPQALLIALVAEGVYAAKGAHCVVTSGDDGEHKPNSLHYSGKALDLRTQDLTPGVAEQIRDELRRRLGDQFDVVLEADHVHAEFDPES